MTSDKKTVISFLSLAGLNLELVLENGARLYSMDLKEFTKEKANPTKRQRKGSTVLESKGLFPLCPSLLTESLEITMFFSPCLFFSVGGDSAATSNLDVLMDRSEMNRQLGLGDQSGAFIANILESQSGASISSLITEVDLADNEDDTVSCGSEGNDVMGTSTSVIVSPSRIICGHFELTNFLMLLILRCNFSLFRRV